MGGAPDETCQKASAPEPAVSAAQGHFLLGASRTALFRGARMQNSQTLAVWAVVADLLPWSMANQKLYRRELTLLLQEKTQIQRRV